MDEVSDDLVDPGSGRFATGVQEQSVAEDGTEHLLDIGGDGKVAPGCEGEGRSGPHQRERGTGRRAHTDCRMGPADRHQVQDVAPCRRRDMDRSHPAMSEPTCEPVTAADNSNGDPAPVRASNRSSSARDGYPTRAG